jgi:hypothetical protein
MRITVLFLLLSLFIQTALGAEPYRRTVQFEWDPIEGAVAYDLELQRAVPNAEPETLQFKIKEAAWSGLLTPGEWTMRVRSRDKRQVPGDWSSPEAFSVGLLASENIKPKLNEELKTEQNEKENVQFEWKAVPGAESYVLKISDTEGKLIREEKVSTNTAQIELPVAQIYTWTVQAFRNPNIQSKETPPSSFTVFGRKLEPPNVQAPTSEWVRELQWPKTPFAESYDYLLSRQDPESKKWVPLIKRNDVPDTGLFFDAAWPGGTYRFVARAEAKLRPRSEKTEIIFEVRSGDRSPAAQEMATIRESIDRTQGWFATASYLITQLQYDSQNFDGTEKATDFQAIGGTGRLGIGYLHSEKSWGGLGVVDYSGFYIFGKNHTYGTVEFNALKRSFAEGRGELRQQLGVYMKEIPEVLSNEFGEYQKTENVTVLGAHYGVEYWYALTSTLGFQANAHVYLPLTELSTPNGKPLKTIPSFQWGFLGSYRLSPTMTGLMGYALREDQISYESTSGATNKIKFSGHYLNLFVEWSL